MEDYDCEGECECSYLKGTNNFIDSCILIMI